ncbi:MAG: hypothetical protein QW587_04895 [Candidatus Bathyarchaeia archaeon]
MADETDLEPARKLAGEIIDLFEELLVEKGIKLPSKDRSGDPEEASIYGEEYYRLEDEITELLRPRLK